MRIIYIYQYFGTPAGQWSTRVYEFTRRWVKQGHAVTVITSPYDKSDITATRFIEKQEIEGVELIVINAGDSNRYPKWKRIYRSVIFSILSSYYAVRLKADIIISSSGPITVGLPGILGKWLGGKKLIFEVRDLWPSGAIEMNIIGTFTGYLGLSFEKLIYSNASKIVTCSTGMMDNIYHRFPKFRDKLITIPNVANEELFNSLESLNKLPDWAKKEGIKVFLYAGSLGIMDAVHEAIEGFLYDDIPKKHHLVIIGDGVERMKLEQLVFCRNKQDQIHFLGLIPKLEVYQWYKIAHYSLVLFANYDILGTSSPNKLFDSIAAGVPVIQNTKGWIYNLILENNAGHNVISRSPRDYFLIFNDSDDNNKIFHTQGIKYCQQIFKLNSTSNTYLQSIESLLT